MIEQNGNLLVQHIRVRMNHNIITTVNLVQGDTAREFHFFFDDYIVPKDSEIRIYVEKPSGLVVYATCSLKNNEIIVHPTLQMVAEKGKNLGQIQIINNDKLINTFVFYLAIEENLIFSSSITSTNEFEMFNGLLDEAKEIVPKLKTHYDTAVKNENDRINAELVRQDTFNALKTQFDSKKNEADNLVASLSKLEDSLNNSESIRQDSFNKKINEVNTAISDANTAVLNANLANTKANEAYTKATDANNVADETIKRLNGAIDSLDNINPSLVSISQPQNQNVGGLWFVEVNRS